MQLSRNCYTNKGRTYQTLFLFFTYYEMVFKMALYLFRKNEPYFYFLLEHILMLFEGMKIIFKNLLYLMN